MISYRTLLFGTIAVVAAAAPAAPALADSVIAQPLDSVIAQPLAAPRHVTPAPQHRWSMSELIETVVQFEHFLVRIAL